MAFKTQIYFFLFYASICGAQDKSSLTGVITDAETGEKLPYVNVFLANTTIGDASDSAGVYLLERIPGGAYEAVFSRIGYELHIMPIQLAEEALTYNVALHVKPIEGAEVLVEAPAPDVWNDMFYEFSNNFIGTSSRAKKCNILNPEVLNLTREPGSNALLAATDSVLLIRNETLGYDIRVVLTYFRWLGENGNYVIYPQFSDVAFANERIKKRCYKERQKLFRRSLRCFLSCLARFDIPRTYSLRIYTTNPRPGYKPLDKKDLRLMLKRPPVDEALRRFESTRTIRVEHEMDMSASFFKLNYGYIDINQFGNFSPMDGLTLSGYWGTLRLADTLPVDYWPEGIN